MYFTGRIRLSTLTYKEIQAIKTYDSLEKLESALDRFKADWDQDPQSVADWVTLLTTSREDRWESRRAERFPWDNVVWTIAIAAFLSLFAIGLFGAAGLVLLGALYVLLAVVETLSGCVIVIRRRFSISRGCAWRQVDPFVYWLNITIRWASVVFIAVLKALIA